MPITTTTPTTTSTDGHARTTDDHLSTNEHLSDVAVYLYLGNINEAAVVWSGWVGSTQEEARAKAIALAFKHGCDVTLIAVPKTSVIAASVRAVSCSLVTQRESIEHYREQGVFRGLRNQAPDSTNQSSDSINQAPDPTNQNPEPHEKD